MVENTDNQPATKADLKALATKAELADGLTGLKTELTRKVDSVENRVARLEDITKNIALDMVRAQSDISDIKERMATRDDISRVLNHIDAFAAEALSYRNHDTLRGGKIAEHETKLENHETRLSELETNPR